MEIDTTGRDGALRVLGQLLADRGLHYEVVAIGGGSRTILFRTHRPNYKGLRFSCSHERSGNLFSANPLPPPLPLLKASEEVGIALHLGKDWLNIGPASLLEAGLPEGFL